MVGVALRCAGDDALARDLSRPCSAPGTVPPRLPALAHTPRSPSSRPPASPCALQVPKALERAGISKDDVEVFELNEAFASQVCVRVLVGQGWRSRVGGLGSGACLPAAGRAEDARAAVRRVAVRLCGMDATASAPLNPCFPHPWFSPCLPPSMSVCLLHGPAGPAGGEGEPQRR